MRHIDWELTGGVEPATLVPARLEAHAAAQVVSVAGRSLLPPRPDDSQTSLAWSDTIGGLVGEPLPSDGARVALRFDDLVLCLVDTGQQLLDRYPLVGKTASEARHWLAGALTGRVSVGKALAAIDFPPALAADRRSDAPFVRHAGLVELGRYYANTHRRLGPWESAAHPIRLWPHHFDIAVLLDGPRPGQTIGVGMSPGDGAYAEPYWYVTPWPYPDTAKLPPLPGGGEWHTDHWVGAVLAASRLNRSDAARQCDQVDTFTASAIAAARGLLDRSP